MNLFTNDNPEKLTQRRELTGPEVARVTVVDSALANIERAARSSVTVPEVEPVTQVVTQQPRFTEQIADRAALDTDVASLQLARLRKEARDAAISGLREAA